MKANLKAKDLIKTFTDLNFQRGLCKDIVPKDLIKIVALVTIDELIKETQFEVPNIRQRYWQQVKNEIYKL